MKSAPSATAYEASARSSSLFVAIFSNVRAAFTTVPTPSSLRKNILPSAAMGDAEYRGRRETPPIRLRNPSGQTAGVKMPVVGRVCGLSLFSGGRGVGSIWARPTRLRWTSSLTRSPRSATSARAACASFHFKIFFTFASFAPKLATPCALARRQVRCDPAGGDRGHPGGLEGGDPRHGAEDGLLLGAVRRRGRGRAVTRSFIC